MAAEKSAAPTGVGNLILRLEAERHERRILELNQHFQAQLDHLTRVSEANEEYFRRRLEIIKESKPSSFAVPPRAKEEKVISKARAGFQVRQKRR